MLDRRYSVNNLDKFLKDAALFECGHFKVFIDLFSSLVNFIYDLVLARLVSDLSS